TRLKLLASCSTPRPLNFRTDWLIRLAKSVRTICVIPAGQCGACLIGRFGCTEGSPWAAVLRTNDTIAQIEDSPAAITSKPMEPAFYLSLPVLVEAPM